MAGHDGLELGAVSAMLFGFREREGILDVLEHLTGPRMNHAYIRLGGVSMDMPADFDERVRVLLRELPRRIDEFEDLLSGNPIWIERNKGVGILTAEQCLDYG